MEEMHASLTAASSVAGLRAVRSVTEMHAANPKAMEMAGAVISRAARS